MLGELSDHNIPQCHYQNFHSFSLLVWWGHKPQLCSVRKWWIGILDMLVVGSLGSLFLLNFGINGDPRLLGVPSCNLFLVLWCFSICLGEVFLFFFFNMIWIVLVQHDWANHNFRGSLAIIQWLLPSSEHLRMDL